MREAVLDHGFVRLVSHMMPCNSEIKQDGMRVDAWDGDLEVVRNARVSYDADWRTGKDEGSDAKLIRSMTTRDHTSPFEAMVFTFEVKAPIFVFRQWHRHRTWSYNELSARYAEVVPEFYIPRPDKIGIQHKSEKQVRDEQTHLEAQDIAYAIETMQTTTKTAAAAYKALIDCGVPRELARCVLPVTMYSRMFATVDLHNLKHFLTLRQDEHAQYEIRVYADAMHKLASTVCPEAMAAFDAERDRRKRADAVLKMQDVIAAKQATPVGIKPCLPGGHRLYKSFMSGVYVCSRCGAEHETMEEFGK